ncbi:MAG: hypothetical protein WCG95_00205 [bacterium]
MIKQLFELIQTQSRPDTLQIIEQGNYTEKNAILVYNDNKKGYEEIAETKLVYGVTSASALVDFIKEECRRRGNLTGNKSTLQLTLTGGDFRADTDFNYGKCEYNRKFSQQWIMLQQYANKTLSHKQFMLALKKLKPSIESFDAVFRAFSQIRLIGNSKLISNPIFTSTSEQSEAGYLCKYSLEGGGEGEAVIPDGFQLYLPYGKGTEKEYCVNIELLFSRNDSDELEIEFGCPELDNVEERAIKDEAKYIRENTSELNEILILADF